jgi:hypothetical protein
LARLRFGLHLVAGRREERLLFDHQKSLATLMGLQDEEGNLAVEQMMQGFFRAAAAMLRINDRLLQRFEEQLAGASAPVPVSPGFELRHGSGDDRRRRLAGAWARCWNVRHGRARSRTRAAFGSRARWPILADHPPLFGRAEACARFIELLASPRGADAQAHGAARRARAVTCRVRQGRRTHAVRFVPCLHGRPAHLTRFAPDGGVPARRAVPGFRSPPDVVPPAQAASCSGGRTVP